MPESTCIRRPCWWSTAAIIVAGTFFKASGHGAIRRQGRTIDNTVGTRGRLRKMVVAWQAGPRPPGPGEHPPTWCWWCCRGGWNRRYKTRLRSRKLQPPRLIASLVASDRRLPAVSCQNRTPTPAASVRPQPQPATTRHAPSASPSPRAAVCDRGREVKGLPAAAAARRASSLASS